MDTNNIRKTVVDRRKELGVTQAVTAERSSNSRETIVRFEKGGDIGLRRLERLCAGLGLEVVVRPRQGRPVIEELSTIFPED